MTLDSPQADENLGSLPHRCPAKLCSSHNGRLYRRVARYVPDWPLVLFLQSETDRDCRV